MKDYLENGLEILEVLGTKLFDSPKKLGTYNLTSKFGNSVLDKRLLNGEYEKPFLSIPRGEGSGKGSFVYVYIRYKKSNPNIKEVIYIGQTTTITRIKSPSSQGGVHQVTGEILITEGNGARNISTFLQVYDLLKEDYQVDVYLIKAKKEASKTNEFGIEFPVIIKPQMMEKVLQDEFKKIHNVLPLLHDLHKDAYRYVSKK